MVYIIFLCLTIPMLLMLPLLEIKSRCIVGFMLLGTVTALSAYEINTVLWATARGFSASLMHGLCTVVAGTGITYVKKQKKLFYTGTFGLLSISITMHALFNLLIQSDYDYIGMAMPLVLYGLIYWLYKGQRVRLPF